MTTTATPTRPDPFALSEEERSVRDTAREFAQRELAPTAAQRDEEERYDRALFNRMGELGLTAIPYPEELGGAGLSYFAWVLACEEIAAADMGMAVSLSVHVLSQLCIYAYGTDEQRARLLPAMTAGSHLGAFALSEPGAGSDAAALALSARRTDDGYALTGTKVWITNAGEAEIYVVFATVDRSRGRDGITAFVVPRETPGFRVGSHERKMGIRGSSSAELVFDDALVPEKTGCATPGFATYDPSIPKAYEDMRLCTGASGIADRQGSSEWLRADSRRIAVDVKGGHEVQILDIRGRVVFGVSGEGSASYAVPALPGPGVYLVKARSNRGTAVFSLSYTGL